MEKSAAPLDRIFGIEWTPERLQAAAASYELVQTHTSFNSTVVRLASRTDRVDMQSLRALVTRTMGRVEGTYWMVAALAMAHLALSCPELLTEEQTSLLLTPLAAGENAGPSDRAFAYAA
ncbi:hypothetical protein [uncultured Arthrobacter sp.]|uniref:hypothetical protein n=1 Tax=uncultured Arthrobacter sp. TaxID=114050 RepID=UPI0025D4E6A3|nr:hypothetical protein [uncultured Arthrobacter sp.]